MTLVEWESEERQSPRAEGAGYLLEGRVTD